MAIFAGALLALLAHSNLTGPSIFVVPLPAFFGAAFIVILVGVWDDYKDLPAVARLLAQVFASLIMIFGGGVYLMDLGELNFDGSTFYLGWMAVPFTVFASLGIINAMNMCDGLDGLSGSLALIALLGFGIANTLWGNAIDQHLIVIFSACVISFLMFNLRTLWRSNAWVFLGDAGSMLLGVTLCWLAISLSQGDERVMSPAAALWFLMLPIYDAVSMMLRRLLKRRSPFSADREHLHHIFLLAGFSVGESVTLMSGIAVAGVVVGLGCMYLQVPDLWVTILFLCGGIFYYWVIRRAWRIMRFLRRSICRREDEDRRAPDERRDIENLDYTGAERRSGLERRRSTVSRNQ
jgi:UDP-GlcNAc:undecaprenyl-phosphate GlcNAc-1-phosphate transferase